MSTPVIAFFNNKGGVGKTSLVYHVAWMCAGMGKRVIAADLDPQANLTAAFLDEDCLEEIWSDRSGPSTVFGCVRPLLAGTGDVADPLLQYLDKQMSFLPDSPALPSLLVGDLALSGFEDELSAQWPQCLGGGGGVERAFRVISAFWRILQSASANHRDGPAEVILVDLGPNLGAINRAALIAADYVVVPLAPDLFSLQGLENLGPTLRQWRKEWNDRLPKKPSAADFELPPGDMTPIGYIVLQHAVRMDRPVKAYERWIAQIPRVFEEVVLEESGSGVVSVTSDPHCLSLLKHYRSLMPMAQEARKPVFYLKPADGAIGGHGSAVQSAYHDFRQLARTILERCAIPLSS